MVFKNKINLGLDLQGGSYLLLEVQIDVLYQEELENFSDTIRLLARDNSTKINQITLGDNDVQILLDNNNQIDEIRKSFFQMYRNVGFKVIENKIIIELDDLYKKIFKIL